MFRAVARCLAPAAATTDGGHLRRLLSPNSPGDIAAYDLFNTFAAHFSQPAPVELLAASPRPPLASIVAARAQIPAALAATLSLHVPLSEEAMFAAAAGSVGSFVLKAPPTGSFAVAPNEASTGGVCVLVVLPGTEPKVAAVSLPASAVQVTPGRKGALARAALKAPFTFRASDAVLLPWLAVQDAAAAIRSGCTLAKASMLLDLKDVCALHASHAARYGAHLCNDQLHQRRIAALDAAAFGLQAFTQVASGGGGLQTADVTGVDFLGSSLLRVGSSDAALVLGLTGSKLAGSAPVPHASDASKLIHYGAAMHDIRYAGPALMAETDFGFDKLALSAIGEELTELRRSPRRAALGAKDSASPMAFFSRKAGAATTRLQNVHMNLTPAAAQIEQSIQDMLFVAAGRKDTDPVTAVDALVTLQLGTELVGSLAALYRASAALTILEDETAAQREATLATVFCDLSRSRRAAILRRHALGQQLKGLKAAAYVEYDEVATNCIELGTAAAPAAAPAGGAKDAKQAKA